ncbi:MAG: epoxide hydrolase family protein [Janthinobacterium lividum]
MTITPFKIAIAQTVLDRLQDKLQHADITPEPVTGWQKGTSIAYMQELLAYWRTSFNWRTQEAELNQYPHFTTEINGQRVHFLHIKGQGPNPRPLLLTHGWPDSFYRFHKVIPLLTDPAAHGGDAAASFDLIIPSLPGFGFSELAPLETTADTWQQLMTERLGYEKFYAAGGDIGAIITKKLAERYPTNVVAIHLTEVGLPTGTEPILQTSETVRNFAGNLPGFLFQEGAFLLLQGSKPQTLAFALVDSPLGYAAWVTEKFNAWTDNNGNLENAFTKDELLTHIMLYLVSGSVQSSLHAYYDWTKLAPTPIITVPTAFASFPKEPIVPPREWVEANVNLLQYSQMPAGGHFPAWEEPVLYSDDLRTFFTKIN